MIALIILVAVIAFIRFAYVGFTYFVFGCGRRFKNGRKCAMWSCTNCSDCPYSKYYKDPAHAQELADQKESGEKEDE